MQRPHSEERRPASHSQNQSSLVTRSLQFSTDDHRDRKDRSQPRRPNTTPKPHIQRLLPSPGRNTSQQLLSLPPSTLTRLPDSPPRLLSLRSIECMDTSKETHFVHDSGISSNPTAFSLVSFTTGNSPKVDEGTPDVPANLAQPNSGVHDEAMPSLELLARNDNEEDPGDTKSGEVENNIDALVPQQKDEGTEDNHDNDTEIGPLSTDIGENQSDRNNEGDDEYKQALANRKRLLKDEANRQLIREELELYVGSLSSRTDENGDHLIEFPRNYQQIVSLMTQKDVSEEEPKSQEGQHSRQSWSRVLIESGLSKQQAFGILEDVDDDSEGSSSLAAKIALKMARIRQLDTILEEKLGKNLYANTVPRKQKSAESSSQSNRTGSNSSNRTFVTQPQAATVVANGGETSRSSTSSNQQDDELAPRTKKNNNFIERNKQVVANGMKANMTKDEEDRLEKLLSDEPAVGDDGSNSLVSGESPKPETEGIYQECNEFTMPDDDKKAIEELIATKSGAYPLFAIDELQDGPTDEALLPSGDSNRPVKDNIIQEAKRERLQRRRLNRVEQELRFLKESPSVVIVGDDRDEDDNDDCRSEISYTTVASSACSTRSGVISRHDFKCFLAQQKESFRSTPTASAEEIRRLLLSMGQEAAVSSNTMAATTG